MRYWESILFVIRRFSASLSRRFTRQHRERASSFRSKPGLSFHQRLEPLEERVLLAGDLVSLASQFDSVATETELQIAKTNVVGNSQVIDQGDYYWADGRKISLYRRLDEVTLGTRAGGRAIARR